VAALRVSKSVPCALTIAGSDSGGGAGIQADLHTFAALGVHGTSALTCVTAQNPKGVSAVEPCRPATVREQIKAVFAEFKPGAVKTGMLYSDAIVREVTAFFQHYHVPLVVDPVMVATSGACLLKPRAVRLLTGRLFPLATLVTPNLDEAQALLGEKIGSIEGLREAAQQVYARFGCAVLVKGGHLRGLREAVDIFFDGTTELMLSAPFVRGVETHGTGCTYSAAITAFMAKGFPLTKAVSQAKQFITDAIAKSRTVGAHSVLNWQNVRAKSRGFG